MLVYVYVKRLKRKCDYLESQNSVYKTQLDETKEEKEDLVSYLQKSLTEEKTIVKELEDRLIGMQQVNMLTFFCPSVQIFTFKISFIFILNFSGTHGRH